MKENLKEGEILMENRNLREENVKNVMVIKKFKSLARMVSHDLRAPIGSSISCILLCKEMTEDKEMKNFLSIAEEQNRKVLSLIDNVLTWARMQLDDIKVDKVRLNLKDLITNTISPHIFSLMSKGINLRHDIRNDICVFTDKDILQSIVRNIFTNAIKFTNKNGNISISAEDCNGFVKIIIKDDGIGMSPEKSKKVFESVGETLWGTEGEKGTGLGLAMSKELSERVNISLESFSEGEGKGSTFTISIGK